MHSGKKEKREMSNPGGFGTSAFRIAGCVVVLLALLPGVSGCQGSGEGGAPAVSPGSSSEGVMSGGQAVPHYIHATGAELEGAGGGYLAAELLIRDQIMNECMKRSGFSLPVRGQGADSPGGDGGVFDNDLFPDVDRMARTSQFVPGSLTPPAVGEMTVPPEQTSSRGGSRSEAFEAARRGCEEKVRKIWDPLDRSWVALQREWETRVVQIQASPRLSPERASYTSCLVKEGVPEARAQDFAGFVSFLDAPLMEQETDADRIAVEARWTKVFVKCATNLVKQQEKLLVPAKKEFLDQHSEQLRELIADSDAAFAKSRQLLAVEVTAGATDE